MYLYVCSQPGLEEYIALRDPLAVVHLDLYVSRGGFLGFFLSLLCRLHAGWSSLRESHRRREKSERERLCGHVPPKKTTLSLSLSLSLARARIAE